MSTPPTPPSTPSTTPDGQDQPPAPDPRAPAATPRGFAVSRVILFTTLLVGLLGTVYLYALETRRVVTLPTLRQDIAAYRVIQATDVETRTFKALIGQSDVITQPAGLIGRYTLGRLAKHTPLRTSQVSPLVDTALVSQTAAVSLGVDPHDAVGQALRVGEQVDLIIVGDAQISHYNDVLVIDLLRAAPPEGAPTAASVVGSVVIAVPLRQRDEIVLQSLSGNHILFSRTITP